MLKLISIATAAVMLATPALAADWESNVPTLENEPPLLEMTPNMHYAYNPWYVGVYGGVGNFDPSTESAVLFDDLRSGGNLGSRLVATSSFKSQLGEIAGVQIGRRLSRYMRAELDFGASHFDVDAQLDIDLFTEQRGTSDLRRDRLASIDIDADLWAPALTANVLFDAPISDFFVPYFGFGVGGAYVIGSSDIIDDQFALTWQVQAGVHLNLSERYQIQAGYRFQRITDVETVEVIDDIDIDAHIALVGLKYWF